MKRQKAMYKQARMTPDLALCMLWRTMLNAGLYQLARHWQRESTWLEKGGAIPALVCALGMPHAGRAMPLTFLPPALEDGGSIGPVRTIVPSTGVQ